MRAEVMMMMSAEAMRQSMLRLSSALVHRVHGISYIECCEMLGLGIVPGLLNIYF